MKKLLLCFLFISAEALAAVIELDNLPIQGATQVQQSIHNGIRRIDLLSHDVIKLLGDLVLPDYIVHIGALGGFDANDYTITALNIIIDSNPNGEGH